jgi:hypothetical protein
MQEVWVFKKALEGFQCDLELEASGLKWGFGFQSFRRLAGGGKHMFFKTPNL